MINYSLFSLNIFLHKRNDPRARISPSVARNSSIHRNRKISTNNDGITSAARGFSLLEKRRKSSFYFFFPFSRGRSDRFCDEGSAVGGEEEEGSRKGSKKGWLVLSKRGI